MCAFVHTHLLICFKWSVGERGIEWRGQGSKLDFLILPCSADLALGPFSSGANVACFLSTYVLSCITMQITVTGAERLGNWKDSRFSHKETPVRASLVAQWLRICLPVQGTQIRSLVPEDPTCCGAAKPVGHNY